MNFFPHVSYNLQKYVITRYIDREIRNHIKDVSNRIVFAYNNRIGKELLSSFTYSFDHDELHPNLPYTANILHFIIEKVKELIPSPIQIIYNEEKNSLIILSQ